MSLGRPFLYSLQFHRCHIVILGLHQTQDSSRVEQRLASLHDDVKGYLEKQQKLIKSHLEEENCERHA